MQMLLWCSFFWTNWKKDILKHKVVMKQPIRKNGHIFCAARSEMNLRVSCQSNHSTIQTLPVGQQLTERSGQTPFGHISVGRPRTNDPTTRWATLEITKLVPRPDQYQAESTYLATCMPRQEAKPRTVVWTSCSVWLGAHRTGSVEKVKGSMSRVGTLEHNTSARRSETHMNKQRMKDEALAFQTGKTCRS